MSVKNKQNKSLCIKKFYKSYLRLKVAFFEILAFYF